MKLKALFGTGLLAVATLAAAVPAEAQRYGRDGYHRGEGRWHGRHHGYGYGRGDRWHRGYGRSRVVCRFHRGYDGPVRRCFRVYR